MVHEAERGEHDGPFIFRNDRSSFPLDSFYRTIAVHSHEKGIAELSRRKKVGCVTGVYQIEAAVCKNDFVPFLFQGPG